MKSVDGELSSIRISVGTFRKLIIVRHDLTNRRRISCTRGINIIDLNRRFGTDSSDSPTFELELIEFN